MIKTLQVVELHRAFGRRMQEARKAKGFTQYDLADLLEVSHVQVAFWEMGRNGPRVEKLPAIAGALGVSLDWLFGIEGADKAAG